MALLTLALLDLWGCSGGVALHLLPDRTALASAAGVLAPPCSTSSCSNACRSWSSCITSHSRVTPCRNVHYEFQLHLSGKATTCMSSCSIVRVFLKQHPAPQRWRCVQYPRPLPAGTAAAHIPTDPVPAVECHHLLCPHLQHFCILQRQACCGHHWLQHCMVCCHWLHCCSTARRLWLMHDHWCCRRCRSHCHLAAWKRTVRHTAGAAAAARQRQPHRPTPWAWHLHHSRVFTCRAYYLIVDLSYSVSLIGKQQLRGTNCT